MPTHSYNFLDDLDLSILEHLNEDGRKSFSQIGEELRVPEATVRYRFNRMTENKTLRIIGWVNPRMLGFKISAHISINVEVPHLESALSEIVSFREVTWIAKVTGEYNLMLEAVCVDIDQLSDFLGNRLYKTKGVRHIEVAIYQEIVKVDFVPALRVRKRTRAKT